MRALHPRLDSSVIFDDPFALAILPPSVRDRVENDPASFSRSVMARYLRTFLVVRSRFAEEELQRAVARGVRQYVVLGAGFDTFALRNPYADEGLRVFELDHPATQKAKLARLAAAGVEPRPGAVFAPVDLATTSLDDALASAGFDRTQPSFFAWLGVSMYLEIAAVRATLRSIAALPDATVVFDFSPRVRWYELVPRIILALRRRRVARMGEPWRSQFRPDEMLRELTAAGFRTARIVDGEELTWLYVSGTNQRLTRYSNIAVGRTAAKQGRDGCAFDLAFGFRALPKSDHVDRFATTDDSGEHQ
jgi:methyltransferase (TIGR00027 family)